ncbi:hypothetical protein [Xanthobacter sp. KR7-225]|uniref:hypothetical protein n=1 Tax=Xanthobacter sp. KR7-225 TaxID=3156613 RepID=UPI0032B4A82B
MMLNENFGNNRSINKNEQNRGETDGEYNCVVDRQSFSHGRRVSTHPAPPRVRHEGVAARKIKPD